MKKLASLLFLAVAIVGLCACGDGHSKAFQALDKETSELERKIEETNDCDELRLFSFSILGLKGDVENLQTDETVQEAEIETLNEALDHIEALWNGKIAALDCKEPTDEDNELDTSGEDDFNEYDILWIISEIIGIFAA